MTPSDDAARQQEVFTFLADPANWTPLGPRPDHVAVVETHGALVFLAGSEALKVKRAVRLAYLDFSTLDRRKAVCERELELNRPAAPGIYREVLAITRQRDGALAIGGTGTPVEWALRMARFPDDALLTRVAETIGISRDLALALADMAMASHAAAPVVADVDTRSRLAHVVATIGASCSAVGLDDGRLFEDRAMRGLADAAALLARRAAAGSVRRCHGDMHLGNVVLWQGRPVPFDAIEFDEDLATVDTLYDVAFLLMDLDRHGCRAAANAVLGRYLWRSDRALDIEGLALLPVFLAIRAGVRAMVRADRAGQIEGADRKQAVDRATESLSLALGYLAPPPPRLILVGGLSGTGKSTLAAGLAPLFGAAPGALHLRSDLERKALAGVAETTRLPADAYAADRTADVYKALARKADLAIAAGHSVIVDAVFARPGERAALTAVAEARGVPASGLWLEATADTMRSRVAGRTGDASDATVDVVERQLHYDLGELTWARIDAGRTMAETLTTAGRTLGIDVGG